MDKIVREGCKKFIEYNYINGWDNTLKKCIKFINENIN